MIHAKELKNPILHTLSLMTVKNVSDVMADSKMLSVIRPMQCPTVFWIQCSERTVPDRICSVISKARN